MTIALVAGVVYGGVSFLAWTLCAIAAKSDRRAEKIAGR